MTEQYESPLLICLSWKHWRRAARMTAWLRECVSACVCVLGENREKRRANNEEPKKKARETETILWGPDAYYTYHTCELQVQTRLRTEPEGNAAPAVPSPLPFLLLTHLCSVGKHVMSQRNPLRMSLSEQATITHTCQALPVGIKSNTSDCRYLLLTIEPLPQSRIRLDEFTRMNRTQSSVSLLQPDFVAF